MNQRTKKQFIAGAICPECKEMDSLVLFTEEQQIECVSCDFKQTSEQRDAALSTPANQSATQGKKQAISSTANGKPNYSNVGSISITEIKD
jgi:uncharacterized metal-binding protein (TIGR02443 family)